MPRPESSKAGPVPPRRAQLGQQLRRLRARRFNSGSAFAQQVGWPQKRVSRIELGRAVPTEAEVRRWVDATGGLDDEQADQLAALVTDARLESPSYGGLWQTTGAMAEFDAAVEALDTRSTLIAEYQPAMVPGLAQTAAYARAALAVPGGPALLGMPASALEEKVAARVRRRHLLLTQNKRLHLLMGEAALRTRFGDVDLMLDQLSQLVVLASTPHVELGILRFDQPAPLLPLAGWAMNDDNVWPESLVGERRVESPADVAAYASAFRFGMDAAAKRGDAVALIRATITELRG